MVLTMHFFVLLEYLRNIMQIKNVKIQLITLVSFYFANTSMAFAGLPQEVPEPSAIALFAIAGAVAFIIKKRKK